MTALDIRPDETAAPARPGVQPSDERARLRLPSAAGLGAATLWLSLLVLIPLAAVVAKAFGGGLSGFWNAVTAEQALASLRLTVLSSLAITLINAVMGTVIAWVLVRDDFRGKRLLEIVIDIPFALPTIVAGLVLISVYGPQSPIGLDLYGTRIAVAFALLFVTLPFVARAVQPVLQELDVEVEQAAACLGASRLTVFRRIALPLLLPAIASGAGLGFARAMGEYGSVLLISGGLDRTQVTSLYAYGRIQNYDYVGAAAVSTVLLVVSLVVLLSLDVLQRKARRRG
ncbi:sulfate ABC transporter permease subunit CysT [Flexivirga caeni]|uniref:Sulfate transport system permease protein CysT n=1 Tax=Flexivirga caeni TaxID=2294115 RepID=A0A3M9M8Q4_9MICO|nr:sulfate ABC transporter permease subunit CysT [Flexivirga caeni]RNI20918.1 sulfate ABC transporter permease subunit CysT [Flexivirga caeni]